MPPVGRQSAVRIARPKKWLDTAGLLMEIADDPPGAGIHTISAVTELSGQVAFEDNSSEADFCF